MYRQFNIQQFYVLPTHCIYVFCVWISEQTAIISLYSIYCLVFITETENVYCAVRAETINFNLYSVKSTRQSTVHLQNLAVYWLVKNSPTYYATRWLIIVMHTPATGPYRQSHSASPQLSI